MSPQRSNFILSPHVPYVLLNKQLLKIMTINHLKGDILTNFTFLYVTVSTLNPTVGMVVTD